MRSLFSPFAPLAPFALLMLLTQPALAQAPLPAGALFQAASAAPTTLTLAAAIKMAFEHDPGLFAATRDRDITAGQRAQARVRPNVELSYLSEGLQSGRRTTTIQLSQAIELGGKRDARIASAQSESEVALADLGSFRSALRADVVGAFFEVLVAQERLTLALASQQLSRKATGAAARRVLAGKISPVEETRARVAEANTKIELAQAGSELALTKRRLAAFWGDATALFDEVATPESPVASDATRAELQARLPLAPQMIRAQREIERQQALADVERSRRLPDLTVSLGSKRDDELGQRQTVVGLSLPIPLFDRNQGNLRSALGRTDKARDQLRAVQHGLSLALAQASIRLDAARSELAILRSEILPGAQRAYEAGTQGFELGKFSFLDVLDAQRTLFQAKTQYIGALARSHQAAADIERIVGNVGQQGELMPASIAIRNQEIQ